MPDEVLNQQTNQAETAQDDKDISQPEDGGDTGDNKNQNVEDLIKAAVDKEVAGLRNKNHELLGKLKRQQEMLKPWEGLDPDKVRGLVQKMSEDEETRLIAEGKVDEVVQRRVQDYVQRHNTKMEEVEEQFLATQKEAEHWKTLYNNSIVKNHIATSVKGLEDGSLPVVQDMLSKWLTVEDGTVITTEDAPLWSKGKLRVDQIQDYLIEQYPFFFKPSTGGGATVGKRSYMRHTPRSKMTAKDKAEFFAEMRSRGLNPVEEYQKLPD